MNTSEKIASVVAQFIAADREEDRKRIAELERDFARALVREREANERTSAAIHRVQSLESGAEWERKDVNATIANLNKQLDELNAKCAALVVENKRLREDDEPERKPLDVDAMNRVLDAAGVPPVKQESTLRIDTDMSDPQPGKLLVVRLEDLDIDDMLEGFSLDVLKRQRVGFLVETPAVKRTPKVGDRVRILDGANAGEVATVRAIDSVDPDCFCLMLVNGERWFAHVDNLEVIE